MAILNTATGTVAGDVAQIRTAIYGREVRASIAEAIELLDSSINGDGEDSLKSRLAALQAELEALRKEAESVPNLQERLQAAEAKLTTLQEDIRTLQNHAHNIDAGFVPMFEAGHSGLNWTVYRWADGTTTFDRIRENPALAAVSASPLAKFTPTSSAPISPGYAVTAMPSSSANVTPASSSAFCTTGSTFSQCLREAISGTTPPYCLCSSTCEETTLERISVWFLAMLAAVSSQELSIPNISIAASPFL